MPESKAYRAGLHGIQILRAIAALAVVLHHALEMSNGAVSRFSPDWLTTSGASGVDIFFVISGFIMFYVSVPIIGPPIRPATFLFRRTTRIYPFYWVCCLGILLISSAGFLHSHQYSIQDVIGSLLLLPGVSPLLGVSWTLIYEMYFYLVFATMLNFRSPFYIVAGTTVSLFLFLMASKLLPDSPIRAFFANPLPIEFCMGLWLAMAYTTSLRSRRTWAAYPYASALGFVLLAIAPLFVAHPSTTGLPPISRVVAWGLPATLIVATYLATTPVKTTVGRAFLLIGDASYALYLTHVFVMIGYGRLLKIERISAFPQLVVVPIIVFVAVVAGIAAHIYVELPLLAQIRRVTKREFGNAIPA